MNIRAKDWFFTMALDVTSQNMQGSGTAVPASKANGSSGLLLGLFLFMCLLPISFNIIGQKLDPVRLYLVVVFFSLAAKMFAGKAGGLTLIDGLMVAFSFWMIITLVYNQGPEVIPYSIISAIQGLGGYMAGRLFVRSPAEYRRFIKYYLAAMVIALPLATFEFFTGKMVLREIFKGIFTVLSDNSGERYGFKRVQLAFPHAILYGLFCAIPVASICYLYGNRVVKLLPRLSIAVFMTLTSLSSGPLVSMFLQISLVIWGKITRDSWMTLLALFIIAFISLEILSNRGPVIIFIEAVALNPWTAWTRVYQWQYGTAAVMAHPFLGIGLGSFERPSWLTHSVDNFWLLIAIRHGLVGVGFLALAWIIHIVRASRLPNLGDEAALVRKAHVVTLVGLAFTLFTVHVWDTLYVMTMFVFGSGAFLYTSAIDDTNSTQEKSQNGQSGEKVHRRYTRFPVGASSRSSREALIGPGHSEKLISSKWTRG